MPGKRKHYSNKSPSERMIDGMENNLMQGMTFAALMTVLSELEESKGNESIKTSGEDKELPTFTARDDIDPSNGRERLYNMLQDIIHEADKACNVQSETDDYDGLINGMIVGTLYQAISEIDTDDGQKINILDCGLKYFELDSEFTGGMFFGDDKQTCTATAAACWHLAYACYENCNMPVPAGAREHLVKMRIYDSSFRCSKPL